MTVSLFKKLSLWIKGLLAGACLATLPLGGSAVANTMDNDHKNQVLIAVNSNAKDTKSTSRTVPIPKPLSAEEVVAYKKILSLQSKEDWQAVDSALEKLSNDLLKGYLLAERYLSPSYRPDYPSLVTWMSLYADLPQAEKIYELASNNKESGHLPITPPILGSLKSLGVDSPENDAAWENAAFSSQRGSPAARKAKSQLYKALTQDNFSLAEKILIENKSNLSTEDANEVKTMAAAVAYYTGHDEPAIQWSTEVAKISGDQIPAANWIAGLALWRNGKPELALPHFEAIASSNNASSWLVSAGAFWAGRANLVTRRPEFVNHWMEVSAGYPRTFYGLLARQTLGYDTLFSWDIPRFTQADAIVLARVPGVNRALGLLQLGLTDMAEEELRRVYPRATKTVRSSLIALSQIPKIKLPSLALYLAGTDRSVINDISDFPIPKWAPANGWHLNPALVYAFIRQESRFNTRARSPVGARGLMQLMPATARSLGGNSSRLFEPAYNLYLGQKYIIKLLAEPNIKGNLIFLAAGYNAGPGNLDKWLKAVKYNGDPLLFIESIPARETRSFIEKILTNFWIYSARMGQKSPTLEAVATGAWPIYQKSKPL